MRQHSNVTPPAPKAKPERGPWLPPLIALLIGLTVAGGVVFLAIQIASVIPQVAPTEKPVSP